MLETSSQHKKDVAGCFWVPEPREDSLRTTGSARIRYLYVMSLLFLTLIFFFRNALLDNFDHFYGDAYDGIIEISILQHWYNYFLILSDFSQTNYFFPYPGTIGYNDTYFLPGIFYTLTRLAGADPFLAALGSHVVMKSIGFLGMYVLLRRGAAVRTALALAGAVLFATANASLLHMHHAQLLSVGLLPWVTFSAIRAVQALAMENRTLIYRWGLTFAALYGLTAFNSFYGAWFFGFFTLIFIIAGLIALGPGDRLSLSGALRSQIVPVCVVIVAVVVALVPLLIVYLPKLREGAHHGWDGASNSLLGAGALINVGSGNFVWGWALDTVNHVLANRPPAGGESRFGLPPGLLLVTALAFIWSVRNRHIARLPFALGCTLAVAVILMTRMPGGFTAWWLVYQIVPGADAVRVVTRFLLFALVPIIFIVMTY